MIGVAIWLAPHRAERSAATCTPVSSPSGRRSCAAGRTKQPALSEHGKGPQRDSAGDAGLTVLRMK